MAGNRFSISQERKGIVIKDITEGSEPELRFYIMVAVSTMIASFGLITNSTAVIIGAMLVAPLMTPIFGIALALIRSDAQLFGKAIIAEIAGVAAAILMGIILGLLYPALEPTPEMITRTEPQLFDLLVAIFSGFAGAYALMDEKISPALPGVAIATAIVPPLANTGLCFSVGEYIAGVGSFLLFFANFLSILLVASAAFWFFGMAGRFAQMDTSALVKRFSVPVICFLLVAAFLTHTLIRIAQHHYLSDALETTIERELLQFPDTSLTRLQYDEGENEVFVLAEIDSSATLTPTQVSRLEKSLHESIDLPTHLIVRSRMAHEISALGSNLKLGKMGLSGSFIDEQVHKTVHDSKVADTVIREELAKVIGINLNHVRIYQIAGKPAVFASIYGIVEPTPTAIEKMETRLRIELNNSEVRLIVNFTKQKLLDRTGSVRLEFSNLVPLDEEQKKMVALAMESIKEDFAKMSKTITTGISSSFIEGTLFILIEADGQEQITSDKVRLIERNAIKRAGAPVSLHVYKRDNIVVTSNGYEEYSKTASTVYQKRLPDKRKTIKKIIEESNM